MFTPPRSGATPAAFVAALLILCVEGAVPPDASAAETGPAARAAPGADPRTHWAFSPLKRPEIPRSEHPELARNPVDAFILEKLEKKGLTLSAPARPARVLRRLFFDLVGLPPGTGEQDQYLAEAAVDPEAARSRLVEELLARPTHGERWARHWLDLARYADSDGQEGDADRPTAYHYRDFVIRAFNEDLPFDTFVKWQLAGDELAPGDPVAAAATGFIVAGPHSELPANLLEEERLRTRFEELDDMLATTGAAFLGLTLGCARCHDHKYDPIPRRDYYRLQSAFNGGDRAQLSLLPPAETERLRAEREAAQRTLGATREKRSGLLKELRQKHEPAARRARIERLALSSEDRATLLGSGPEAARGELERKLARDLRVEDSEIVALAGEASRTELEALAAAVKSAEAKVPPAPPSTLGFADFGPEPRETFLLARGDFRAKSEPVSLGFLTALLRNRTSEEYWKDARATARNPGSTQQRRALAEWITDVEHGAGALVARVCVNRLWQHHFGHGLVRTVNDFGTRSDPPTHPELLEWLAAELVAGGWRIKPVQRLIVESAVYLQDSTFNEEAARADPENRLLWRKRPLRLEAEILRDTVLAVSGALNTHRLGPAFKAPVPAEALQARNVKDPYPVDIEDSPATHRRSIYMFHKRVVQNPLFQAFDGPDAQASCGRRETTTVAPQALALLNDSFVRARAAGFARRLEREAGSEAPARVRLAWRLAFAREPTPEECRGALDLLASQEALRAERDPGSGRLSARELSLVDLCQALLAANELLYVN